MPMPPPSEKYWWPVTGYNTRWERICWYWAVMNEMIDELVYKSDSGVNSDQVGGFDYR